VRARSLYTRSPTSDIVAKPCESQVGQQTKQSMSYACRVENSRSILLKLLPEKELFCVDCEKKKNTDTGELVSENENECCPLHSASSPVPSPLRIRTTHIISVDVDELFFEIRCSCLYHPTLGIPCRHIIASLFPVLPHHIFVRWHTEFFAHYKQKGKEAITAAFDEKKQDRRLIVSSDECERMMFKAKQLEDFHKAELPHDFWDIHCAYRPSSSSTNGLVPLEDEDFEDGDAYRANPYANANGFISQEIGLSQCQEEDNETSRKQSQVLQTIALESSNLYSSCRSLYGMCEKARLSKNPTVESIIRQDMAATFRKVNAELLSMEGGQQDSSEYVSSHATIDRRKKTNRLKSASERDRKRSNVGGAREPAKLNDSMVPW
jgi:hypothetical protein